MGFVMFEVLGYFAEGLAFQIDRTIYTNATSLVREYWLTYRVWELYRALLSCVAGAIAGWIVARVYRSHHRLALACVVAVVTVSLLISLFTRPGYYLRDLVLLAGIALSPILGGIWFARRTASSDD
jgi:hypothetical protein